MFRKYRLLRGLGVDQSAAVDGVDGQALAVNLYRLSKPEFLWLKNNSPKLPSEKLKADAFAPSGSINSPHRLKGKTFVQVVVLGRI